MPTLKEALSELGRIGGSVKSARKAESSRRNLELARARKTQQAQRGPIAVLIAAQKEPDADA